MAGYLDSLGAPKTLVGAVPAFFFGGIAIVQPISLALIPPGPKRYKKMLWAYRFGALGYTAMGLFVLLLPVDAYLARIISFFSSYLVFVFMVGSGDPHYIKAVIECTPEKQRGTFFSYRLLAIGMGGLMGGEIVRRLLKAYPAPYNFGSSILIGSIIVMVSTIWFGLFRSTTTEEIEKPNKLGEYLTDLYKLLSGNRVFLRFIFAMCITVAIQGCTAFVALYVRDKINVGDSILGRLGSLDALSSMIFAVLLGRIGDKKSHKHAYMVALTLYICGITGIILAQSSLWLQASYLLIGAAGSIWVVSVINMGLEYSSGVETSRLYAGINVIVVPFKILGPITAGAMVSRWGYICMLITVACAAFVAVVIASTLPSRGANHPERS